MVEKTRIIKLGEDKVTDDYDVKRHFLNIHHEEIRDILSSDVVMAVLKEEEKTFIRENLSLAYEGLHLIKEKGKGEYCSNRLLLDAIAICAMTRNSEKNHLLNVALNKIKEQEQTPENDIDEEIKEKIGMINN